MNKSKTEANSLKQPVQKRSKATLQRIFDATKRLLQQKRFEAISIHEIAKAANCGTGTVYGRFENKSALLASLEQEVVTGIVSRQQTFLSDRDWAEVEFETRMEKLIEHIFEGYKIFGVVLKELISRVHQTTDGANDNSRVAMSETFDRDVEFLVQGLGGKTDVTQKKVVSLALISAILTIQNRILQLGTSPINSAFNESFLKRHLALMAIAYVRSEYPA